MPMAQVNGVALYYEEHGRGFPLVWSHEFAGDYRSWEPQVRFFSRRYRVITYNARGYPPSDVPQEPGAYSQEQAVEDLRGLLDHLGIVQAYVGGLSMGGSVALHFGLRYPGRARALIVAGAGSGSDDPEGFRDRVNEMARRLETDGMAGMERYPHGPQRIQFLRKDPLGWRRFVEGFMEHSPIGSALTFRGFQAGRAPIYESAERLRTLDVPTLILTGDEDDPCLGPAVFMKRHIPRSGLAVFPRTGHTINLEEPDLFNRTVLDFLTAVEAGRWPPREQGDLEGALVPP